MALAVRRLTRRAEGEHALPLVRIYLSRSVDFEDKNEPKGGGGGGRLLPRFVEHIFEWVKSHPHFAPPPFF